MDQIAGFNEDIGRTCTYCLTTISTCDHIRWECEYFNPVRKEIDEELATIPHQLLPCCLKNGIAPAMKADGNSTYWGTDFRNGSDTEVRKFLGENLELQTPGSDARKTEERQAAMYILEDPGMANLNARQIMLEHKAAHGSGTNPDFPDRNGIHNNMTGSPEHFNVVVYGDGSNTTPTIWWAALGG